MGVKKLNSYLKKTCGSSSIFNIDISQLKGKTIVVDSSIYIYKFLEREKLLENIFMMVSSFLQNNVKLIFIFDGKPDQRKAALIEKRIEKKKKALKIYDDLINSSDYLNYENNIKIIEKFRKRSIRVNFKQIQDIKEALTNMGVEYYESSEESDQLCAYFVNTNKAWACMSDDMDMIVYGCKRIIRNWKFGQKSGELYIYDNIIKDLGISNGDAMKLLLLLGTDYGTKRLHIEKVIEYYNSYKESEYSGCFYSWIGYNSFLTEEEIKNIENVFDIYELPEYISLKKSAVNFNINKLKKIYTNTLILF